MEGPRSTCAGIFQVGFAVEGYSDGSGVGRGFHEIDSTLVQEIDRIVALGPKGALVRLVGSETNDRWVALEEMKRQELGDLIACFTDRGAATLARAPVLFRLAL